MRFLLLLSLSLLALGCSKKPKPCKKDSDCSDELVCLLDRCFDPRLLRDRDCAESDECKTNGKCSYVGKVSSSFKISECKATKDEHCAKSENCTWKGECSLVGGECVKK